MRNLRPVRAELRQLAADIRVSVRTMTTLGLWIAGLALLFLALAVLTLIPLNIVLWGLV